MRVILWLIVFVVLFIAVNDFIERHTGPTESAQTVLGAINDKDRAWMESELREIHSKQARNAATRDD